jgi:hypothetical protein
MHCTVVPFIMSLSTTAVKGCPGRYRPFCVMKFLKNKVNVWAEGVARDIKTWKNCCIDSKISYLL